MRITTLMLTMLACKGGAPTDSDDQVVWPPSKAFQTHEDEGSVVAIALEWPDNPHFDAYALFADDLQGFTAAAACAREALPCVRELPEDLDVQVRANNRTWIPSNSESRWVGDHVSVGPVFAPITNREDVRMSYYEGTEAQGAVGGFRLRFGGEWADFDQALVPFAERFQVVSPELQVGERIDLSGDPVTFHWIGDLQNEVWLWIQGPSTRQVFRLRDDGSYELNPRDLGLDPAEVVEVGLAAVTTEQVDVDGNLLTMHALKGRGWKGTECGEFLDVQVPNMPPVGQMDHPLFYGFQFQGIIDDGLRDFIDPDTGEPESAKLLFTFYDDTLQPVCEIEYDASDGGRDSPLLTDTDATLFQTYKVGLFNGRSTCGLVDPTTTGFADLRNWLEQFQWGFALGELEELEEPLRAAIGEESWEGQKDLLYGVYWTQDGLFGDEQGYGYNSPLRACDTPAGGVVPKSTDGELNPGYFFTFPYFVQPILQ